MTRVARLCDVPVSAPMLCDARRDIFRMVSHVGARNVPIPCDPLRDEPADLPVAQSFRAAHPVHVTDMQNSQPYREGDPACWRVVDNEALFPGR